MTSRSTRPAVTVETLGAWLVKASPSGGALEDAVRRRFENLSTRCVRSSYRTALVEAGQPVLLWFSGGDSLHPSGLHATGRTTGPVVDGPDGPMMTLHLAPVTPIVPREALLGDRVLGQLEVLRMPAGSNPSFLDRSQYAALCAAFPQVDHGDRPTRGTA